MATTTSINKSSLCWGICKKIFSAALLSANTIENGGIKLRPNVKYKSYQKLATDAIVKMQLVIFFLLLQQLL